MGPLAEDPRRLPAFIKQAPDGELWQLHISLPGGGTVITRPSKLADAYVLGQREVDARLPHRGYIVA